MIYGTLCTFEIAMGAKQKEAKPVASKSVPAAKTENGVTDTVTIANGQKVNICWLPCTHMHSVFWLSYPSSCSVRKSQACIDSVWA